MAAVSNIPREIQDSIREILDRRVKLSIKRLVRQELRSDKIENKVLAFSACRLFILTAKVPSKVDFSIHYLDLQAIESKKPNQLSVTVADRTHVFRTLEVDTEEINHMITHVGIALKQIFPGVPIERLIKKLEVSPPERLKVMYDMMEGMKKKEPGPCGGFSHMYACMCDYHLLPYRDEVSWDVDTIYLSQDSRELCLKDFDHLDGRDLIPVISALEHNEWFTKLNINNVKLVPEAYSEILKVVLKNGTIEELHLSNTGIKVDFVQKLSTALLSNSGSQLTKLDLSHNLLEDRGLLHLTGALVKMSKGLTYLDLTKTGITGKSLIKLSESLSTNKCMVTSLQTLMLADNSLKGDENAIQALFNFLALPNSITHLDLSNTEVPLDGLSAALLRGCAQNLVHLNLASNIFTVKKTKEVLIPSTWKNFFASAYCLQWINLSGNRLPPESIKELLLGLSSNMNVNSVHLDLSGNEMKTQGARYLENVISNNSNITSLDISDNGLDQDLCSLLAWTQQNKGLNKLAIGRNFTGIKTKQISNVLESVVQLIQDEDSVLESLSLADAKLRVDTGIIINALGSNTSLTEIDISGNQMGDFGARMLAKALQINTKLRSVYWDRNNTTVQGFEDIASALEKNYTLRKMPVPVSDTSAAIKLHPERMEAAVQKIESLLQRNHSTRKFASDQAYRLQQGFLISSTQQLVDRLVVQVQDTIYALNNGSVEGIQNDLDTANDLMKDAEKSRQLLPRLQEISMKSQDAGNPVQTKLNSMAKELGEVLERHLQSTVEEMLKCTDTQCVTVMSDKEFQTTLKEDCHKKSSIPQNFAKYLLDGVETDVINKLSESNLSVAARVSDRVMDEVIDNLSKSHKTLTNHLNVQKSSVKRETTKTPKETKNEVNVITITEEDKEPGKTESPGLAEKRKNLYQLRKQRPQSVVERKLGSEISPDRDRNASINTLKEDADLDPEKEEGMSKVNFDAPPSGAVESLEYKGHNLDLMTQSVTSVSKDSLEDITDSKPAEKVHIESLDVLPEMANVPKLSHVNKARPKRAKAHAVSRPMTKPVNLVEDEALETPTTNSFFETKSNPAPSIGQAMPRSVSKTDENENEKTPSSCKPEKKKWSPFANKDKEKDKKEKTSGKHGFASGISNLFSRKQPSGQSKFTRDEKRSSENVKIDKKAATAESLKSNGPTYKEKKEDSGIAVEVASPSSPPVSPTTTTTTTASDEPVKSPSTSSASKLPPGRGPLLMGGDLLAEMKQKRGIADKPSEKKDNKIEEAESKSAVDKEPKVKSPEDLKVTKRLPEEPKVTKPTPEEPKLPKASPEPPRTSKLLPELPKQPQPDDVKSPEVREETSGTKVSADEAKVTKASSEPSRISKTLPDEPKSPLEDKNKASSDEVKSPTAKVAPETAAVELKKPPAESSSAISKPPSSISSQKLTENSKNDKVPAEVKPEAIQLKSPVQSPISAEPKRDSASNVLTKSPTATISSSKDTKSEPEPKVDNPKPKTALLPPARRPTPKPRAAKPAPSEPDSTHSSVVKRISKPPPPLPGSKPKPPPPMKPRLSGIKSGSDESDNSEVESDKATPLPVDKGPPSSMASPSGIVYDSSTLRLSVKGKIKKLGLDKKIDEEKEKSKTVSELGSVRENSLTPETPRVSADTSDSRPVSLVSNERSPRTSAVSPDNPKSLSANGFKDPMTVSQSNSSDSTDDKKASDDTSIKSEKSKGSIKRASLAEEEVIYI